MYKRQEEHIEDIVNLVRYADELDIAVNVYLEDWSNGMKDSSDYVFPISHTHLLFNKNTGLCQIERSSIQPDTCPVLDG